MKKQLLNEINRYKSLMNLNEAQDTIRLGDENYDSVSVDSDTQGDAIPTNLLADINTAAERAGVNVTITTARSGHRLKTASHNISRHSTGQAVDIAIINGRGSGKASNATNGNAQFRADGNKFVDELVKLGYTRNQESGNEKAVLWQTNVGGNHFNHIHISNKSTAPSSDMSGDTNSDEEALLDKIKNYEVGGVKVGDIIGGSEDKIDSLEDFLKIIPSLK